jgi:hypothetical protein
MASLTTLGIIHTAISLLAVGAGIVAFGRSGKISPVSRAGRLYLWMTVITCVTGFGIFQHGGFGKPHALGVLTLLVLGVASIARRTRLFGENSIYVETVSYTLTFFFHMVPALTETFTRLPASAPVFSSPDDPVLAHVTGLFFLGFLAGVAWQIRQLRRGRLRGGMTKSHA